MTNLIINEQQIRERIPSSANVEMSLLRPNILLYQETRLEEILGSTFYNHFVQAYINTTLTGDEIILLGHIHPTIAYGGLGITIPFLAAQISNRGIINQSGDFTAPSSDTTLRLLRESVTTSTSHYEERLIKFLKLNKSLYPLWKWDKDSVQNPETQSPNDFGMVLDSFDGDCFDDSTSSSGSGGQICCSVPVKSYASIEDFTSWISDGISNAPSAGDGPRTDIFLDDTYYKLNSNMTASYLVGGFTFSNQSLIWNSATPSTIEFTGICSINGISGGQFVYLGLFVNGILNQSSEVEAKVDMPGFTIVPFQCLITLNQGDTVEVYVKLRPTFNSPSQLIFRRINIIAKEI